jgi:hypothetical protein
MTLTGIDDRLDGQRAWPLGLAATTPLVADAAFIDFGRSPTVIGKVGREPEGLTASLTATPFP